MKKQIVYDFVKSINNHDVDRIYQLMDDDFRFIDAYGNGIITVNKIVL